MEEASHASVLLQDAGTHHRRERSVSSMDMQGEGCSCRNAPTIKAAPNHRITLEKVGKAKKNIQSKYQPMPVTAQNHVIHGYKRAFL